MQEKKIHQKYWERERNKIFVKENYAKNERGDDKYIIRECEWEETK